MLPAHWKHHLNKLGPTEGCPTVPLKQTGGPCEKSSWIYFFLLGGCKHDVVVVAKTPHMVD